MARYFGGFRDRLKKKSRNLSISEKDIEWIKVATSFSWSPAKREYQWLEPEDYLSSFLSSNVSTDTEFGDVSPATEEGFARQDEIEIVDGMDGQGGIENDNDADYMPAYEFNPGTSEDSLHGIPSDILADLPHIDEYKLEIASALQRRGIHVEPDSVQVPDELAFHLKNYHEKGRSSLDSYELRARLQYFKKQVIESYEQLSAPPGGFQVFDENLDNAASPANANGLANLDEDEKFIVSSLDRLEASLKEDTIRSDEPISEAPGNDDPIEESTGDSYSASFSIPPSSFADDSWLVLPIDTAPSQGGDDGFEPGAFANEDEIFTQVPSGPDSQKKPDEPKKRTPLFKSAKQSDNNGVIKAFNNLKSNTEELQSESDSVHSADQNNLAPDISPVGPGSDPFIDSELDTTAEQENKGREFSLFNKKTKTEQSGAGRDRKLFDSKRKTIKDQRTEVTLPGLPKKESEEKENSTQKPDIPVESRTEVKLPSMYRREVVLPGQESEGVPEPENEASKESLPEPEVPEAERTVVMDFDDEATPANDEVSLSDLLLKLRNDSDLRVSPLDEQPVLPEEDIPEAIEQKESRPDPLHRDILRVQNNAPVETTSLPQNNHEKLTEPLVDPLEALAKPASKPVAKEEKADVDFSPVHPSMLPKVDNQSETPKPVSAETESSSLVIDGNDNLWQDIAVDIGSNASIDLGDPVSEEVVQPEYNEDPVLDDVADTNDEIATDRVNETMDQRRARYIEEERKKLYSLIGRLEQNTVEPEPAKEIAPVIESQDPVDAGIEKSLPAIDENPELAPSHDNEDQFVQINLPTDRAVSLMDYIDAVPDDEEDAKEREENIKEKEEEVQEVVDFQPQIDEVIDNLQQGEGKDITVPTSKPNVDKELGSNMPIPPAEAVSPVETPPVSRPVIPINEEEVVMPESQKDEQVPTADVQEVIEQTEKEVAEPVTEAPKPPASEKPAPKPSMEFDQMGLEFENLLSVVECLAFAAEEPIPLKKVARIYSEVQGTKMPTENEVLGAVDELNKSYEKEGRSFRIKSWGRGIRMATHPQYANYIRALYQDNRPKKLSRTLMETLSIIAYSQPTTKPEIDFVRGVDSDYAVRKLLELGLIDIVGRSEAIGRPLLYGTSERFLDQFGLSEIEALPKLREVEELLGDPAFQKERLHLLALEGLDDQDANKGGNAQSKESESVSEETEKQD